MEYVGGECFSCSGIEEITLPSTLKEIGKKAFENCDSLKTVWVEDDFALDLANVVRSSVKILSRLARVGDQLLLDIRKIKQVIMPDGAGEVGDHWFWGSQIGSITVPASVKKFGTGAFDGCWNLKSVIFAPESRLEKIGSECFHQAGIERIAIPKNVEEI